MSLRNYLEHDTQGNLRDDLAATWSGNVASHSTADLEMDQIASGGRCADPIAHVILSWRPGEYVSEQVARESVNAVLESMGAHDRQWFAAMHEDDERIHVHLAVNRVDPYSYQGLDLWRCHAKLARAAEWIEREYGCLPDQRMDWRATGLAEIELDVDLELEYKVPQPREPGQRKRYPASSRLRDGVHRAGYAWAHFVDEHAHTSVMELIERPGTAWSDVHATLDTYGLQLVQSGRGHAVIGSEPGQRMQASDVLIDMRRLEEHLGPFTEASQMRTPFMERMHEVQTTLPEIGTWRDFHARCAEFGIALDGNKRGGRVIDLAGDGRSVACRRGLGISFRTLEKQFGPYERPTALMERDRREEERRGIELLERGEHYYEHSYRITLQLQETLSIWDEDTIEREVRAVLNAPHGSDFTVARVVESVKADCETIQTDTGELYTTRDILKAEEALHQEAAQLAKRCSPAHLRAPSAELDAQQGKAYRALTGESALAIVTGIAGAGKSRLLRDVAAAYEEQGYQVMGCAVSGDAARVLGEEARIDAFTVARLKIDLQKGRKKLTERSVVIVDEASMLGTDDTRELFVAVEKAGARILLLGDAQQHGSVARGTVLEDLIAEYGSYDMATSRRANDEWMRTVAVQLREGRTTAALGTLREQGCIQGHDLTHAAKVQLAKHWAEDLAAQKSSLLIATRRDDVAELNLLARERIRTTLGEERMYTTAFGERAIAISETLVARRADKATKTVNGDLLRVLEHAPHGQLLCERVRDKKRVLWDLDERPEIDYGYATTSYRSQGRTVDTVHVLATKADERRGLYVDVTRARERVSIAYGRDEIASIGELFNVGMRAHASHSLRTLWKREQEERENEWRLAREERQRAEEAAEQERNAQNAVSGFLEIIERDTVQAAVSMIDSVTTVGEEDDVSHTTAADDDWMQRKRKTYLQQMHARFVDGSLQDYVGTIFEVNEELGIVLQSERETGVILAHERSRLPDSLPHDHEVAILKDGKIVNAFDYDIVEGSRRRREAQAQSELER